MAASNTPEFQQLFAAHSNRDLTAEERLRLKGLAGQDLGRRAALAEVDALHELLDQEQLLQAAVLAPADAGEEADESFRRLQRSAAGAEEGLRAQLLHPRQFGQGTAAPAEPAQEPSGSGSRRTWLWLAAALFLCALVLRFLPDAGPALDPNTPDQGKVLGGGEIVLTTEIRADEPVLAWGEVLGARRYQAEVVDAAGQTVLARSVDLARETSWRLETAEFQDLAVRPQLFLRVVAKDKDGKELARTRHSQPLKFR